MEAQIAFQVHGVQRQLTVDTGTTLLDALRDRPGVMSPKNGLRPRPVWACTVLLDRRHATTCLSFEVAHERATVTTAQGLADRNTLHPVQQAFVDHDAFQSGYLHAGPDLFCGRGARRGKGRPPQSRHQEAYRRHRAD
jgi:xanthine dehydrogenase YagT iron-sulfur-binding subunit